MGHSWSAMGYPPPMQSPFETSMASSSGLMPSMFAPMQSAMFPTMMPAVPRQHPSGPTAFVPQKQFQDQAVQTLVSQSHIDELEASMTLYMKQKASVAKAGALLAQVQKLAGKAQDAFSRVVAEPGGPVTTCLPKE